MSNDDIYNMVHLLHDQHNALIAINAFMFVTLIAFTIITLYIWRDVHSLLAQDRLLIQECRQLIGLVELHGEHTDRNRKKIAETADQLKNETLHVAEAAEDVKTRILEVKVDTKQIKEALLDGQNKTNPPTESKP